MTTVIPGPAIPGPVIPGPIDPPARLLMGPGPSPVHPDVYAAMGTPLLGHMDPGARSSEIMITAVCDVLEGKP